MKREKSREEMIDDSFVTVKEKKEDGFKYKKVFDDRSKRKSVKIKYLLSEYNKYFFVELADGDVGVINGWNETFISEDKDCGWLVE